MPDTRMTFTLVGRDHLSRAFRQAGVSAERLNKDLRNLGASAAIPAAAAGAAAALSLGAAMAAAAGAVGAFGAAVAPQAKKIGEVSQAQQAYRDAVKESGRASQEAAEAELAYLRSLEGLPPATREAAAGFLALKDVYKQWSDSVADDTMPVLTKSFATFSAILPKLTPLVRGTSAELDRLMTIVAGGVASNGFSRFISLFDRFATSVLSSAVDGIVNLTRASRGFDGGPLSEFLAYAQAQGPLVADTLQNVASAMANLLLAGSELGVAMLTIANGFAQMVNAIPPSVLATLLQLYAAFRLLSLGAAGVTALGVAVRGLGRQLIAMRSAAGGAAGGLASLRAAFMALSATVRGGIIIAAVAAVVVAVTKLSEIGQAAPPDIDALEKSLIKLSRTGKVAGESARLFSEDLAGFGDAVARVAHPSNLERMADFSAEVLSLGFDENDTLEDARKKVEAFDEALANLVENGHADIAAAALKKYGAAAIEGGTSVEKLKDQLPEYEKQLENAKIAQQLAADGMGLFGQQALKTKTKLDEQKASAEGLRQAIQALNDVHRAGLGGMIGFEAAIDAATKAAKENAGALEMSGGKLKLSSESARTAASSLQELAARTDEAAAAAHEADGNWTRSFAIYDRGRSKLITLAMQMGLTRAEAKKLADQILKTPDKTVRLKGDLSDLAKKVDKAVKRVKSVPPSKVSKLKGDLSDLRDKVIRAQERLKSVPKSKRSDIQGDITNLRAAISEAQRQLNSLHDKTVNITTNYLINVVKRYSTSYDLEHGPRLYADGGLVGYVGGGSVQRFPGGGRVRGPGTGTSDDVPILASNGEYVIRAAAVARYGVRMFDELNAMRAVTATPISAGAARRTDVPPQDTTYNIYPQRADFTVHDLEALQRRQEARARVGRPR